MNEDLEMTNEEAAAKAKKALQAEIKYKQEQIKLMNGGVDNEETNDSSKSE